MKNEYGAQVDTDEEPIQGESARCVQCETVRPVSDLERVSGSYGHWQEGYYCPACAEERAEAEAEAETETLYETSMSASAGWDVRRVGKNLVVRCWSTMSSGENWEEILPSSSLPSAEELEGGKFALASLAMNRAEEARYLRAGERG